ncbi:NAD(P)/FAD-dependent oxidoreductase [Actibacterium lipolyticum]|uniref:Glycine oxidase n=1 Tax=Actibacterium lipolyticum TaxID=1524263 RepID=A0A238JK33_9RHOB|nr:FAD-dependent oxidoreductase [Actibacterium lipolyticum]SMX30763.1 Glycine oxidase [Actibacterium lipolyticum]
MATVDLTVMGAGAFGLSVAFVCAARGAKVRVIEKRRVGAGSSGGIVGALAPHAPERWNDKKAFQFESLVMAEQFWANVERVSGLSSGYGRTGRLQPIINERGLALAHERAAQAAELWQGKAQWRVLPYTDFADWAPPSPTGYVIHDTLTARLHPAQSCAALAGALTALGGEVVTGDAKPEGAVLWATGYEGLMALSAQLDQFVGHGEKGQALLLKYAAPDMPQLFADTVHFVPHADGTLAIGSTTERDFDAPDTTDAQLDGLLERALAAVPQLAGAEVLQRWAGVRPRAKSRAPMLGEYPGKPGHFIANGGFKIGFGVAPKVAELMADLILNGKDSIPPAFRVEANL